MATTLPRPDPSSPTSVAGASFSTARKGYDVAEVRAFLQSVSRELADARSEIDRLTAELSARPSGRPVFDEGTAVALLGEETTRVLRTAHEGAASVQARSEEGAARLLREAQDDASTLRHEVELECVEQRRAADRDAEATIAAAKQEARDMLAETRAVRERMLSDLARRREAARLQLERLDSARGRIADAFADARTALDDALDGINDAFTIGEALPALAPPVEEADDIAPRPEPEVRADDAAVDDVVPPFEPEALADDAAVDDVVPPFEPEALADDAAVDDLFARLRAASTDGVAASLREDASNGPDDLADGLDDLADAVDDATPENAPADAFAARAILLAPVTAALARSLKRALSDEQNDVLDRLRRHTHGLTLDLLVGGRDEQAARYAEVAGEPLAQAYAAGALGPAGPGARTGADGLVTDDVVLPLRERLQRALDEAHGDTVEASSLLRAAYREWKTQRLDALAADLVYAVAGRGAFDTVPAGTPICWRVDPSGSPCPDADDNALAGIVAAGDPFPTGHRFPPAHAGCRCLIARGDG
jgi:DivIVA domain-containing protein